MDEERIAASCEICGGEIYSTDEMYLINGECICEDCLGDYARRALAGYRLRGDELWR